MKIRMLHSVQANDPWNKDKPGVLELGKEYPAKCNNRGQISALSEEPRDLVVVKPGEYELILDGVEWERLMEAIAAPPVFSVNLAIQGKRP